MRILFIAHMWCPVHNAGGETTVHAAMREMVTRGHEVRVICRPWESESQFVPYTFEGVSVVRPPQRDEFGWMRTYANKYDPDLLITHLDLTPMAMMLKLEMDKPLVHFVHNSMQFRFHRVNALKCQLAIFNSHWVAEAQKWEGPQITIHPIVEPERYQCERGEKITLVNPTPGKGADTFYALAKALPDLPFLTVKSVYGEQIAPPNINPAIHPNVETLEHTADIREVFRKTKVLLMPSNYESYGRVAIEAACCGIPTIAHPTPGLLESLGDAGTFHDRDDIPSWKSTIERLYSDDVYYRKRSDLAIELADSLDPGGEFDRLEESLLLTLNRWEKRNEVVEMAMWTSDRRLWETSDGKLIPEIDGRIPANAVRLGVGIGGQIPEEVARANGLLPDAKQEAKAVEAPEENKAVEAPKQTKKRTRKKVA